MKSPTNLRMLSSNVYCELDWDLIGKCFGRGETIGINKNKIKLHVVFRFVVYDINIIIEEAIEKLLKTEKLEKITDDKSNYLMEIITQAMNFQYM